MKWLAILFALFIGIIILLANTGHLASLDFLQIIPYSDKAGHFLLYGILALLINLTLFRSYPQGHRIWIAVSSSAVLALLIGLEEWSQQLFVNRTFSFADLGASYLGVIFFAWVAVRTK
ncbi:MAG TPA: VanZ family protein [Anaerolineales bacterium]|nr:VanZ family protein [Anaerolineales bacterium]